MPTYPSAIAIAPDSNHVYIAGNNPIPDFGNCGCRVFVLDTASTKVVASIPLDYPQALPVSPDGTSFYVVSAGTAGRLARAYGIDDFILSSVDFECAPVRLDLGPPRVRPGNRCKM